MELIHIKELVIMQYCTLWYMLQTCDHTASKKAIGIAIVLCLLPCIATAQTEVDHYDHRNMYVDSLEHVLTTNPPTGRELREIYRDLSLGYSQINLEKSTHYARKCIEVAISLDSWGTVSQTYRLIGLNFSKISQFDSAKVYFEESLEAVVHMHDFPDVFDQSWIDDCLAACYGEMGNNYNRQSRYPEAIEYYTLALRLFEKWDWGIYNCINAYNNIGELYFAMSNFDQAEFNYLLQDSLSQVVGDHYFIAMVKKNLAALFTAKKAYDKALQNAVVAYDYFVGNPEEGEMQTQVLNLLAAIYLNGLDDVRRAEEYARQALQLSGELNIPRDKAAALQSLSTIYLKRNEWRRAEQTALEALATDDTDAITTLALYALLAKAYAWLGNARQSTVYFDRHDSLQVTWSNLNYQTAIRDMETKYETEKKEREIVRQQAVIAQHTLQRGMLIAGICVCAIVLVLLWAMLWMRSRRNHALTELTGALSERNEALTKRNEALAEINATKDKFFNIISHDLKDPALTQRNAIEQMVKNAHLWHIEALTAYYKKLLESADGQVALLYNLLDWAQLQTGRMTFTPRIFNLSKSTQADVALIRKMAESKNIRFEAEIPEKVLVTGDQNMLATIIRNLLTNAIKYTPTGGSVSLNISEKRVENSIPNKEQDTVQEIIGFANESEAPNPYIISVTDTGIGMSAEQIVNVFNDDVIRSRQGTGGEKGSGLGLIVCRELVEKHGSILYMESELGRGSRFWFEI